MFLKKKGLALITRMAHWVWMALSRVCEASGMQQEPPESLLGASWEPPESL